MVEQIVTKYLGGIVTITENVGIIGEEKLYRVEAKLLGIRIKSQSEVHKLTDIDRAAYAADIKAKNAVEK